MCASTGGIWTEQCITSYDFPKNNGQTISRLTWVFWPFQTEVTVVVTIYLSSDKKIATDSVFIYSIKTLLIIGRNEPRVRPANTQISLGIRPVWSESSLVSLNGQLRTQAFFMRIRLGGCSGWSESSLGVRSLCWFCHEAAQISHKFINK